MATDIYLYYLTSTTHGGEGPSAITHLDISADENDEGRLESEGYTKVDSDLNKVRRAACCCCCCCWWCCCCCVFGVLFFVVVVVEEEEDEKECRVSPFMTFAYPSGRFSLLSLYLNPIHLSLYTPSPLRETWERCNTFGSRLSPVSVP